MFEDEFGKLDQQASRRVLEGLEATIWAGVAGRMQANRHARLVYSCQTAVLALGLIMSVAAGTFAAARDSANGLIALTATPDLAPSTRLIGR